MAEPEEFESYDTPRAPPPAAGSASDTGEAAATGYGAPAVPGRPPAPAFSYSTPPYLSEYAKKIEGIGAATEGVIGDYQGAMGAARKRMFDTLSQPLPQVPQTQPAPPPPDAKTYQKGAMEWLSAMAVLGAFGTFAMRRGGTAALQSFAAAGKGWQEGNQIAYENASKQWEQQYRQVQENNRNLINRYKMVIENKMLTVEQQMAQMNLISAEFKDQLMYQATREQNATKAFTIYDIITKKQEEADKAFKELTDNRAKEDQQKQENAAYWLSPEGQQRFETLTPQQQAGIRYMIEHFGKQARQPKPEEVALQKFQQENPGATSAQVQAFIAKGRPPRNAPAMAMQAFKDEFAAEHGREPTAAEIIAKAREYALETQAGRTAGGMQTRVENASNEVVALLPQALETSRAFPRGNVVLFTKLYNDYKRGISDPRYADFSFANFSLVNAYTRAMNPQGVPRVQERLEQHAIGLLSENIGTPAYETQLVRLLKEVQASKAAVRQTGKGMETPEEFDAFVRQFEAQIRSGGGAVSGPLPPGVTVEFH